MDHSGYLDDSYLRYRREELAEDYLKVMHNVSVYDTGEETRQALKKLKKEKEKQEARIKELEIQVHQLTQGKQKNQRNNEPNDRTTSIQTTNKPNNKPDEARVTLYALSG